MKPLKRPMFRSGGPIKEGIMDGMQEPQAINTVGNNANRDIMGREKHAFFLPFLGANALRAGAMRMAPRAIQGIKNFFTTPVTKTVPKQGPSFQVPGGNVYSKGFPGGKVSSKTVGPGSAEITTRQLKPYFANDPLIATGGKIIQGLTSPTSKGLIQKGARVVFSPTGVATGLIYAGGKFFDSDGNEIDKKTADEAGLYAGDKRIDEQTTTSGSGDPKSTKLNRDEEIEANRKRYYKLMGIDKMQKGAAYDSLIDASNIIREEGGDLKGAIKSGSLQSQIINAISKNLDKSTDLKKQIDAAILKGEITKDINKDKDALTKELTKKRIQVADKQLAGANLAETKTAYQKAGESLSGQNLYAEATRAGTEVDGILDTKTANKFLTDNPTLTEADFVKKTQQDRIKNGQPKLPEGNYVVGGRIVHISEGGLVDEFVF
jgi:hypothetical protein